MKKVTIKQPEEEIALEILAEHIIKIGQAAAVLRSSRLKERTILLLLQDITKLPQRDIKKVLDAQQVLENVFVKPKPKKV